MPFQEIIVEQHNWSVNVGYPQKVKIITIGVQGPPGPSGQSGTALAPISFAYNNATPRTVHTLTDTALILSATLSITEAFDGTGAKVKIGTPANDALLMDEDASDVAQQMDFQTDCYEALNAGTEIRISITPGAGASRGQGLLILELINF